MERTGKTTIERFEHAGERYKRIEKGSEVKWELYNTGWGEHGWLPMRGHAKKEMETVYQNQFA